MYMLLISSVSRMILTLQFMVLDTLAFIVLLVVWIFISAVFFTTLFQDTTSLVYKDLYTTVFVLFDALLGSYGNIGIGSTLYQLHIVCTILYVYVSNVLLLNYLIAIMSTTYSIMIEEGIFMFKVNLYNYCERYLIAFGNQSYCELALHTAPINVLAVPVQLLAFMSPPWLMATVCKYFSYFMYWLENFLFLMMFFIGECFLLLPVYVKNIVIITWASSQVGIFTPIINGAMWIVLGIPISCYILLRDVANLFNIMRMVEGCRKFKDIKDELEDEEIPDHIELKAY